MDRLMLIALGRLGTLYFLTIMLFSIVHVLLSKRISTYLYVNDALHKCCIRIINKQKYVN